MTHVTTAPETGSPASRHSKWFVKRALRACRDMTVSEYSVMLTLSDLANVDDGMIPEEFTPNQDRLAADSKISVRTLRDVLKSLEIKGWVKLIRPTGWQLARHTKIRYQICVPDGVMPVSSSATATERRTKRATTSRAVAVIAAAEEAPTEPVNRPEPPVEPTGETRPIQPATVAPLSLYEINPKTTPPPPVADGPAAQAPTTRLRRGREESETPSTPLADSILKQVDLSGEHVSRWTRARLRKRVQDALDAGWTPQALTAEMTRDLATARSRVGVIQARLAALGTPPRPTPCPPPFVAPEVPRIAPERVRSYADQARAAIARNRLAAAPAF